MKIVISLVIISYSFLFLQSCDKNKELVQYSEYYHQDFDTTYSYILIPNSFSPGKDGINDYFFVVANGVRDNEIELKIFTSSGETVFYSNYNYFNSWDGTKFGEDLPNGVYFYELKATDLYNYVYNIKGQVHLLR